MKRRLALVAVAMRVAVAQPAAFETASVKASAPSGQGATIRFLPGGGLSIVKMPLHLIVAASYNVPPVGQPERVTGGPAWVRSQRFDIQAKAPPGAMNGLTASARIERTRSMLRSLLTERFQLTVRHEAREGPVYALTVAKSGAKLRGASVSDADCLDDGSCHQITGGQGLGLHGKAVDMSDLAKYLENWTDQPVVDRTGLEGLFDIDTNAFASMFPPGVPPGPPLPAPGTASVNDPVRPSLFTILARVGLKLDATRGKVGVIVIERVEHPSVN